MEKLKVAGAGSNIEAKLEACGATGGEVCAAVIIGVEGGKIKGSRWTLVGNLGDRRVHPPAGRGMGSGGHCGSHGHDQVHPPGKF
jgi:hypothetical protein